MIKIKKILILIVSFFLMVPGTINLVSCKPFTNHSEESNADSVIDEVIIGENKSFYIGDFTQEKTFEINDNTIIKVKFGDSKSDLIFTGLKLGNAKVFLYNFERLLIKIFYISVVNKRIDTTVDHLEIIKGGVDTIGITNQDSLINLTFKIINEELATATFNEKRGLILVSAFKIGQTQLKINSSNSDSKTILITITKATKEIILGSENEKEIVMESGSNNTFIKVENHLELNNLTVNVEIFRIASILQIVNGVINISAKSAGETFVRIKADGAAIVEIKIKVISNISIDEAIPVAIKINETRNLNVNFWEFLGEFSVTSSSNEIAIALYTEGIIKIQGISSGSAIIKVSATYAIKEIEIYLTVGKIEIQVNQEEISVFVGEVDTNSLIIENWKYLKNLSVKKFTDEIDVELLSHGETIIIGKKVGIYKKTFSADNSADVDVTIKVVDKSR